MVKKVIYFKFIFWEERWIFFNKVKRIVVIKVYKRLWIYLWLFWYKIIVLVFLEDFLVLVLVIFIFLSGILFVVDRVNNVGLWFVVCYFF